MSTHMAKQLREVSELARKDQYDDARRLCNEVIARFAEEAEPYAKLAYLSAREGKYEEAVEEITRAIERNQREPDYFYSRGRYRLVVGDAGAAVRDFDQVISLSAEYQNAYYLEPARYFRAEGLARIGRIDDALSALKDVRDDFQTWDNGLVSKRELEGRCYAAKGQRPR